MPFCPLPATACWEHLEARSGFEVSYFQALADGCVVDGTTAAIEDGQTWVVTYHIRLDASWVTRSARVAGRSVSGLQETVLAHDGAGHWLVNGRPAPHLDGCLDVDLESSSMTNTLPVHRLALAAGQHADSPAAYVRALDLSVARLEQSYQRIDDQGKQEQYDYAAPVFGFTARLVYDESGLLLDYPGIARRAG